MALTNKLIAWRLVNSAAWFTFVCRDRVVGSSYCTGAKALAVKTAAESQINELRDWCQAGIADEAAAIRTGN
jgi:hypothetical protein